MRLGTFVLCLLAWSRASLALAAPPPPPGQAVGPPQVLIVVIGPEPQLSLVRAALGPLALRGAEIRWRSAKRVGADDVLDAPERAESRCFIDLSALPKARLYLADARAERFLVRELELARGLDELGKEALAQVVESSIETLLEERELTLSRAQLRSLLAPAPSPVSNTKVRGGSQSEAAVSLGWGALYGVRLLSTKSVTHGPALALRVQLPWRAVELSGWTTVQYLLTQELSAPTAALDLTTVAVRSGVGMSGRVGSLWLGARLGIGLDLDRLNPRETGAAALELTQARWVHTSVATGALDTRLQIAGSLGIAFSALADADFRPRHYDLEVEGEARAVIEPLPVRPGAMLGLVGTF